MLFEDDDDVMATSNAKGAHYALQHSNVASHKALLSAASLHHSL